MMLVASVEERARRSSRVVRATLLGREPSRRIAARSVGHRIILLDLLDVWVFETRDRLPSVHSVPRPTSLIVWTVCRMQRGSRAPGVEHGACVVVFVCSGCVCDKDAATRWLTVDGLCRVLSRTRS